MKYLTQLTCDHEESFDTLQECVSFIEHFIALRPLAVSSIRANINGKQVFIKNGKCFGADGDPFCTNEKWHEIFASPAMRVLPRLPAKPEINTERHKLI